MSSGWISGEPWSKLMAEVPWDMVIVDEAHHARVRISGKKREETRLYRAVRTVVSPDAFSKRAALFLTATPMQLDSKELYSLVELLDPALFPTVQHFERHRADRSWAQSTRPRPDTSWLPASGRRPRGGRRPCRRLA